MKLLANENISHDLVDALSEHGFDVASVAAIGAGMSDRDVMRLAHRERRVVLTHDKDFGQTVYAQRGRATGVILIRLGDVPLGRRARTVAAAIASRDDWEGHFSVIEPGRVRMTRLPGAATSRKR